MADCCSAYLQIGLNGKLLFHFGGNDFFFSPLGEVGQRAMLQIVREQASLDCVGAKYSCSLNGRAVFLCLCFCE